MKNLFRILTAVSLLTVFSCSKQIEQEIIPVKTPEETTGIKTYTITVNAQKSDAETRALSLDGNTLIATWGENDVVKVYKGSELVGTLAPQTTGASDATLKGEITGTIAVGDNLTLNFCEPDYGTQDGTLASIAARCDFATATVAVESTDNGIITTTAASFISQQAIVKFTLKESDGTAITGGVTSLKVVAGTEITVTPSSTTNVLYVAIPAIEARTISLMATTSSDDYGYTRSGVTFEKGKYYEISVRMEVVPEYANSAIPIVKDNIYECITKHQYKSITLDQAYAIARYLAKTTGNQVAVVFNHTDTDIGPSMDYALSTDKSAIRQSSNCYYPYYAGYQVYIVPDSI